MIRGLPWRCDLESRGFVVRGLRIVAYAPLLNDAQLFNLIKKNFSMEDYDLMADALIGIRRCWMREEEPVYRLGVNEWAYGLVLLAKYGLVQLEKKNGLVVLNRQQGIDDELNILLEQYATRRCSSTYWKLNFILNSKDYGIWSYVKLYHKLPHEVTHDIIDPVIDELIGVIRELNVNLTYTEEYGLRSHSRPVLDRLLYAARVVSKYLDEDPRNEIREKMVQYLKIQAHEREPYTSSRESRIQVKLSIEGTLQGFLELLTRAKLGVPPVEDRRIWKYQIMLFQRKVALMYKLSKDIKTSVKRMTWLEYEAEGEREQEEQEYYILPDGTRYPLPSKTRRIAFLREYGYDIEAVERLIEESMKLVEEYKESTEYERELILNELRRKLRLAKERLRVLSDIAFNRGFLDLYHEFRREYERIDSMERSAQKELRRIELEEEEE